MTASPTRLFTVLYSLAIVLVSAPCFAAAYECPSPLIICAVYDMEPYTGIPGHHYAMIHCPDNCDYYSSDEVIADDVEECPECPPYSYVSAPKDGSDESQADLQCDPEDDRRRRPTAEHPNGFGKMFFEESKKLADKEPLVKIDGRKINIIRVIPEAGEPFYAYLFVSELTDRSDLDPKQMVVCKDEDGNPYEYCKPAHTWIAVQAALRPDTPADRLPEQIPLLGTFTATEIEADAGYKCPTPYALRTEKEGWPPIVVILGRR